MGKPVVVFLLYANNKDTDQSAQMRTMISIFVVRSLDTIMPIRAISKVSGP